MKLTPAEVVIGELGVRPLAKLMGLEPTTILRWREGKGIIPAKHHEKLLELADGKVSAYELVYGR